MRNRLLFTGAFQRHKNGVKISNGSPEKKTFLWPAMPRGRPRKSTKRNISGLRNQRKTISPPPDSPGQESDPEPLKKRLRRTSPASFANSDVDLDTDWDPCLAADGDSLKSTWTGAVEGEEDEELEEDEGGWDAELEDNLLCEKMIGMASRMSPDEDWVPHRQRWLKNYRKNKKRESLYWNSSHECAHCCNSTPHFIYQGP